MYRLLVVVAVVWAAVASAFDAHVVPEAKIQAAPYHRWAHEHWIWNSNQFSNQANVTQLLDDYKKHNIRFGGVNIDSEWASEFNNFSPDTAKFPDFQGLVGYIHSEGARVILWATSFVNSDSPDFQMAVDKKYLVRNKRGEVRPLHWWHGQGGLLDYSNPDAVEWWHGMMDRVLVLPNGDGVDGFKCDASDPYIMEYMLGPGQEALGYNDVPYESYRQYANYYYGDFFNHTRARRGDEGLIMSRPVDCLAKEATAGCLAQSPKYVMTSGWVGDDDADMSGLRQCARKVIYSAWENYANFACDLGGYRHHDLSTEDHKFYFLRSAQFNAFLPLMENGGSGNHRPWTVTGVGEIDAEITDIYRDLVNQHTRLSPYMLTTGTKALATGTSSIHPLASNKEHRLRKFVDPTTFAYTLGDDVLVHPPLHAGAEKEEHIDASVVEMVFPGDEKTRWLDWWHPAVEKLSHAGGSKKLRVVPLHEYPVYVRAGSLLALWEDGVGELTAEHLTFTWFAPKADSSGNNMAITAEALEPVADGPGTAATAVFLDATTAEVRLSAHKGAVGLALVDVEKPKNVHVKGAPCLDHVYNPLRKTLDIKCRDNRLGTIITVEF